MDLLGEAAVWLRRWSTSPQRVVVGCPRSVGCSVLVSLGDDSGSLLISRSGGSWIRGRCLVCFSSPILFFSRRLSCYFSLLRRPKRNVDRRNFEMSTGLDMSLDDMIAKNRKSRGGAGPARGTGPGPTRRNNPNRKSTRSAPYQSAKAPESTWGHDMFSDRSEDFPPRSSAGIETGTKLYISNLDYGVMNEDIKELFAEVGELKRYTVHFDRSGRSKGTAEVVYSRRGDALAAVKKYNDVQLDGKPMKIEIVGTNLQTAAAPSGRPANGNSNGAPWRGGQGRGGQQRGGGRGGGARGGGGRGRRPGKGPAEKISAEDLDADLDKYHSGDMETN